MKKDDWIAAKGDQLEANLKLEIRVLPNCLFIC